MRIPGIQTIAYIACHELGSEIEIDYSLSFDRAPISRNRFSVKIKEQAVE